MNKYEIETAILTEFAQFMPKNTPGSDPIKKK